MKVIIFFFLILLLISICFGDQPIYTFNMTDNKTYIMNVCIGTPPLCLPFKISLVTSDIIVLNGKVYKGGYEPSLSSTASLSNRLNIIYNGDFVVGQGLFDNISIEGTNITLKTVQMILVDTGIVRDNFYGIIGLAEKDYDCLPFMGELYKNKYVTQQMYSIGQKQFIIGGQITKEFEKFSKFCSNNIREDKYPLCRVNSAFLYNDKEKLLVFDEEVKEVLFDLDFSYIFVPQKFYVKMVQTFFGRRFFNNDCSEILTEYPLRRIECNNQAIEDMKNCSLYVFIYNWNIKFKFKDLFIDNQFQLANANWKRGWTFGTTFLDQKIITIDQTNNHIYLK